MNRLRTLIVTVGTLLGAVAAAAACPAAFAQVVAPNPGGAAPDPTLVPVTHVVHTGMPAWQIALVAVGAALVAAVLTAVVDRAAVMRRVRPSAA